MTGEDAVESEAVAMSNGGDATRERAAADGASMPQPDKRVLFREDVGMAGREREALAAAEAGRSEGFEEDVEEEAPARHVASMRSRRSTGATHDLEVVAAMIGKTMAGMAALTASVMATQEAAAAALLATQESMDRRFEEATARAALETTRLEMSLRAACFEQRILASEKPATADTGCRLADDEKVGEESAGKGKQACRMRGGGRKQEPSAANGRLERAMDAVQRRARATAAAAASVARARAAEAATRLQAEARRALVARGWVGAELRARHAARARLWVRSQIVRAQREERRLRAEWRSIEEETRAARSDAAHARQGLAGGSRRKREEEAAGERATAEHKRFSTRAASAVLMLKGAVRTEIRRQGRRERAAIRLQAAWRRGLVLCRAAALRRTQALLLKVKANLEVGQAQYVLAREEERRDEETREAAMAVTRRLAAGAPDNELRSKGRERERAEHAMETRERLARKAIATAEAAQREAQHLSARQRPAAARLQGWWRVRVAMRREVAAAILISRKWILIL